MRTIKVGDQVQAFLSPEIVGEVVSTRYVGSNTHFVGGTAAGYMLCTVKLKNGTLKECKAADLFHI